MASRISRAAVRRIGQLAVVAILGVAASGCGSRQPAFPAVGRSSDPHALLAALLRDGAPGAVALVQRHGHVRVVAAGLADVETRQPMTAALRFRVGSISKTVVATLVLKLAAEGRLRLSDPIARWFPGLVPGSAQITVRELLAHRSGLPDYFGASPLESALMAGRTPLSTEWTPRALLRLIAGQPLEFAPGTQFSYSNTNYLLLGLLVARIAGMPLERYAAQTLFSPLGMHATAFVLGRLSGVYAHGYTHPAGPFRAAPGGLGDVEALNGSAYGAAASLVSTARDLARFFTALFSGRLIPRTLLALMQTTRPDESGLDYQSYGLGLEGNRYACGPAWGNAGNVWGYRAAVRASRNASTLIVLLVNHDWPDVALTPAIMSTESALYCDG